MMMAILTNAKTVIQIVLQKTPPICIDDLEQLVD